MNTLPKASLFWVEWAPARFYFAKFRLANAMRVQVGWIAVSWRMPWLEHVARTLHPECFADTQKEKKEAAGQ